MPMRVTSPLSILLPSFFLPAQPLFELLDILFLLGLVLDADRAQLGIDDSVDNSGAHHRADHEQNPSRLQQQQLRHPDH